MGKALGYLANHWEGLCVYLDDGRVEMDSNPVENLFRPLTLNRNYAKHRIMRRCLACSANRLGFAAFAQAA